MPGGQGGAPGREAIANVALEACGSRLVASITVEAVRDLGLGEGSEVTVIIKASDVIIIIIIIIAVAD